MGAIVLLLSAAQVALETSKPIWNILAEPFSKPLLNLYSSTLVNHPALTPTERKTAMQWHEWISGPDGRAAINSFKIDGQQLFFAADPAS